MPFLLTCTLLPDAMPALKALRLEHLYYVRSHVDQILFGGPARGSDGTAQEMIIVLRTDLSEVAQAFIDNEPYNASGRVFAEVKVRPWSQVVPDAIPGALHAAIEQERARVKI